MENDLQQERESTVIECLHVRARIFVFVRERMTEHSATQRYWSVREAIRGNVVTASPPFPELSSTKSRLTACGPREGCCPLKSIADIFVPKALPGFGSIAHDAFKWAQNRYQQQRWIRNTCYWVIFSSSSCIIYEMYTFRVVSPTYAAHG